MTWCEGQRGILLSGLSKNAALIARLGPALGRLVPGAACAGTSVRVFTEFEYRTGKLEPSRRVIGKAEVMAEGENPRFIVTNCRPQASK